MKNFTHDSGFVSLSGPRDTGRDFVYGESGAARKLVEIKQKLLKDGDNYTPDEILCLVDIAKAAIGQNFYRWVHANFNSPSLHGSTYRFFLETLDYLAGQQRSISISTWAAVIGPHNYACEDSKDFGNTGLTGQRRQEYERYIVMVEKELATLDVVLARWLSKPDGVTDLMFSLCLMFAIEDQTYVSAR